jgi:8-oxo-dGTP pyrophosphatase MutT (NUDIX family)
MHQQMAAAMDAVGAAVRPKVTTSDIPAGTTPPMGGMSGATHAGGVVYRLDGTTPEFLLVTARAAPSIWVLPKGHIEEGETPEQTAVREVFEESGVTARVVEFLDHVSQEVAGRHQRIAYYLLSKVAEAPPGEARSVCWLPAEAAARRATFDDARRVIEQARLRLGR